MKYFSAFLLFILFSAVSIADAGAQETGGVKGRVRTQKNEVISGVAVTVRKNNADVKTANTDKNGMFEIVGLEIGSYTIAFDKTGYSSGVLNNVEIKKGKSRDLGGRLVMTVDQATLVIIKGIVFNQNGGSVRGASVEIEKKQADGSYKRVGATTSSYGVEPLATGEFVFRFPEQTADYRITASAKNAPAVSKEITVDSAAIYRLALTLQMQK